MWRNTFGFVLAAIAAAAAVASVFFDWYGARDGRHFKWTELFTTDGVTAGNAALFEGMFLPMLVAAALALAAILLRSRLLMLLAGITALGFTILWMIRQYQVTDSLTIGSTGLKWPVAVALASGLLLLFSAGGMAGRHVRAHRAPATEPRTGGEIHEGPWPRDAEAPGTAESDKPSRRRHAA
ncbi:hypothetical protein [Streptomyces specialis]|uniref:hypothetical protein n=1 Tax=Streptomyces specialis TaxID=498367 RepID=UPI00073E881B|nr:hypothetical protein [Streptomyces specialis]